jgi:glucose/arabinose dehydrogenase
MRGSLARRMFRTAVCVSFALAAVAGAPPVGPAVQRVTLNLTAAHRPELFGHPARRPLATTLPDGFQDRVVWSDLTEPTVIQFAKDGRIFVGEKSGIIKIFDGLNDPTSTIFADLSTNVHDYGDRGLLGLALDPSFPTNPFVYVLYTMDAPIGVTPPVYNDGCADPYNDGCLVGARVSKLTAVGDVWDGTEQVLIEDWCQQYISHSIGTLAFGPDGALYVGGGDGASFVFADYGQGGSPQNPCRDPGGPRPTPPTAEGGAFRSQDVQDETSDPTGMNGAILRVDPATGAALPDNPLIGGDPTDDRIIAYGMRNPFRFTVKPHSDQIWVGDVGWNTWEEIDEIGHAGDSVVEDFGWPCYEGFPAEPDYDALNLSICENLYGNPGAVTDPFFVYNHSDPVVPGENCPINGSVISAISFYKGGRYPSQYRGALFFGDTARVCIWVMLKGPNGDPDPSTLAVFEEGSGFPVDLKIGPKGDLFYVDFYDGQIHRIGYNPTSP